MKLLDTKTWEQSLWRYSTHRIVLYLCSIHRVWWGRGSCVISRRRFLLGCTVQVLRLSNSVKVRRITHSYTSIGSDRDLYIQLYWFVYTWCLLIWNNRTWLELREICTLRLWLPLLLECCLVPPTAPTQTWAKAEQNYEPHGQPNSME